MDSLDTSTVYLRLAVPFVVQPFPISQILNHRIQQLLHPLYHVQLLTPFYLELDQVHKCRQVLYLRARRTCLWGINPIRT